MSELATKYAAAYRVTSFEMGYWTGVPTQPWSRDPHQAQLYDRLDDARTMARLLAAGAAVTGPQHHKTATFLPVCLSFQLVDIA